jgi:AraC family transcriptional regulator of adaptative response/methylated-DNA-[protein]-cysteine methyltransferase
VWQALLEIPFGRLATYQDIAAAIGMPDAARAVGQAVGANPVSLIIPCHRVILKSGIIHNYRWGAERKRTVLAIEQARNDAGQEYAGRHRSYS